jgi:hypothetical protein
VTRDSNLLYPPLFDDLLGKLERRLENNKILAFYQVSRFGKTKLCFSLGFKRFVVMLRYKELQSLELPFEKYLISSSNNFQQVLDHHLEGDQDVASHIGTLAKQNQYLVELWLCCYVDLLRLLFMNGMF